MINSSNECKPNNSPAAKSVEKSITGDVEKFLAAGGEIKTLPYGPDTKKDQAAEPIDLSRYCPKTGERLMTMADIAHELGCAKNTASNYVQDAINTGAMKPHSHTVSVKCIPFSAFEGVMIREQEACAWPRSQFVALARWLDIGDDLFTCADVSFFLSLHGLNYSDDEVRRMTKKPGFPVPARLGRGRKKQGLSANTLVFSESQRQEFLTVLNGKNPPVNNPAARPVGLVANQLEKLK